jgi:hypothetical protein
MSDAEKLAWIPDSYRTRLSSAVLVVANLVPLAGVLFLGWRVFDVLMLYWLENVIIGVVNVMRMVITPGRSKWFLVVFFAAHYGVFCFGHLAALIGLFGEAYAVSSAWEYFFGASMSDPQAAHWQTLQWIAVAGIAASHLFSYFSNFVAAGEYRRTRVNTLMTRPYGRIVVLHLSIILGAALIEWLGSPVAMLLVLVAVKIALDLRFHLSERAKFEAALS